MKKIMIIAVLAIAACTKPTTPIEVQTPQETPVQKKVTFEEYYALGPGVAEILETQKATVTSELMLYKLGEGIKNPMLGQEQLTQLFNAIPGKIPVGDLKKHLIDAKENGLLLHAGNLFLVEKNNFPMTIFVSENNKTGFWSVDIAESLHPTDEMNVFKAK